MKSRLSSLSMVPALYFLASMDFSFRLSDIGEKPALVERQKTRIRDIILPDIQFIHLNLRDALTEISRLTASVDSDPNPKNRGVNIILKMNADDIATTTISATMKAPSVERALEMIAKQSRCNLVIHSYWVTLVQQAEETE